MPLPVIAVTGGEPAGIGADICLDLAAAKLPCRPVVLADIGLLRQRAAQLGKTVALRDFSPNLPPQPGTLDVWHIPLAAPCEAGRLNAANSPYVLQLLDTAYQGIQNGTFAAMTTAPLHKGIINDAGAGGGFFSGHTEYLAEKSGTPRVVMMLAGGVGHHPPAAERRGRRDYPRKPAGNRPHPAPRFTAQIRPCAPAHPGCRPQPARGRRRPFGA